MNSPAVSVPVTLGEWLAQLTDEQLMLILRRRRDQLFPYPSGTEVLAYRLELRASMLRALHDFSTLALATIEVIVQVQEERAVREARRRVEKKKSSRRPANNPYSTPHSDAMARATARKAAAESTKAARDTWATRATRDSRSIGNGVQGPSEPPDVSTEGSGPTWEYGTATARDVLAAMQRHVDALARTKGGSGSETAQVTGTSGQSKGGSTPESGAAQLTGTSDSPSPADGSEPGGHSLLPTERNILTALEELSIAGFIWGLPFPRTADNANLDTPFHFSSALKNVALNSISFLPSLAPSGTALRDTIDSLSTDELNILGRLHIAGGRGIHSQPAGTAPPPGPGAAPTHGEIPAHEGPIPHLIALGLLEIIDGPQPSPRGVDVDEYLVRIPLAVRQVVADRPLAMARESLRPPQDLAYPLPPLLREEEWEFAARTGKNQHSGTEVAAGATAQAEEAAPTKWHAPLSDNDIPAERAELTRRAAAEAYLTLCHIRAVLRELAETPARALRDGSLGVRELRRLAKELGYPAKPNPADPESARLMFLLTLARDAGLIDLGYPEDDPESFDMIIAPTPCGNAWMKAEPALQWATLLLAWFGSCSTPWLATLPLEEGTKYNLLHHNLIDEETPHMRRLFLRVCRGYPPEKTGTEDDAWAALAFMAPLHTIYQPPQILQALINDSRWLGLLSGTVTTGAVEPLLLLTEEPPSITSFDRIMEIAERFSDNQGEQDEREELAGSDKRGEPDKQRGLKDKSKQDTRAPQDLMSYDSFDVHSYRQLWYSTEEETALAVLIAHCRKSLPTPTDQLIAQGDMTLMAPGPLTSDVLGTMDLFADVENPGFATIYRVTEESIRRALDAGLSASDLHAFLNQHVIGEVPQSFIYLIDDAERIHGQIRAGEAACYVRVLDPATAASIQASPAAHSVGLKLIAPTVFIGQLPLKTTLSTLEDAGFVTSVEEPGGAVVMQPDSIARVLSRFSEGNPDMRPSQWTCITDSLPTQTLAECVESIRSADAAGPAQSMVTNPDEWLPLLHAAARHGSIVVVNYVDKNGQATRRRIRPVTIANGYFDGVDVQTSTVHRMVFHRIAAIALGKGE